MKKGNMLVEFIMALVLFLPFFILIPFFAKVNLTQMRADGLARFALDLTSSRVFSNDAVLEMVHQHQGNMDLVIRSFKDTPAAQFYDLSLVEVTAPLEPASLAKRILGVPSIKRRLVTQNAQNK